MWSASSRSRRVSLGSPTPSIVFLVLIFDEGARDGLDLPRRQKVLALLVLQEGLERAVSVREERLQGGALLFAVVELWPGFGHRGGHEPVLHTHELRLRHDATRRDLLLAFTRSECGASGSVSPELELAGRCSSAGGWSSREIQR